jgi:hypothetical protein
MTVIVTLGTPTLDLATPPGRSSASTNEDLVGAPCEGSERRSVLTSGTLIAHCGLAS